MAPQYASSQGKTSNCQSLVSVTLASREVPVMVGLRLFLPESWTDDPERMKRARVPAERQAAMSKPDIAIAEIDWVMAAGVRFGCVSADAGCGSGAGFRQALNERGLSWAVGLSSRQTVYPADVELTFPTARGGRPRKYHIPDQAAVLVADMLAGEPWRKVAWRRGTRGRLTCLFAARRVRIAEGHRHRMAGNRVQSMPGDEVWLVGERRSGGEHKYYVSNLPPDTSLRQLAAAIKARWVCETAPATDPASQQDRKAQWLKTTTCRPCFVAEKRMAQVDTASRDGAAIAHLDLPPLTGSERQIAWATSLRASRLAALVAEPAADGAVAGEVCASITNGKWWIDHRDLANSELLAEAGSYVSITAEPVVPTRLPQAA